MKKLMGLILVISVILIGCPKKDIVVPDGSEEDAGVVDVPKGDVVSEDAIVDVATGDVIVGDVSED